MTNDDEEVDLDFDAGFEETRINGKAIYWRHWVYELPTLSAFEFSRLNAAVDPDRYADFLSRAKFVDGHTDLVEKVVKTERLANAKGMVNASAREWIVWAESKRIRVYFGFRLAVEEAELARSRANVSQPAKPLRNPDAAPEWGIAPIEKASTDSASDFDELNHKVATKNDHPRSNKKKWDVMALSALWKEINQPGATQAGLAAKHEVSPQRISYLLKKHKKRSNANPFSTAVSG